MMEKYFKRILVAINGTTSSIQAVQYAIVLAKNYQLELHAVFVVDTTTLKQLTLNKFFIEEESDGYEKALTADGEKYLDFAKKLGSAKGVSVHTHLVEGAVWSEVVSLAEQEDVQLIILGESRRQKAAKDASISPTYKQIMANASCSVLFANDPDIESVYDGL
ncbi:MAG: universal stress protein [Spirochaetaceae bacterium]|nr:universal stress protein [Spirochaetaceae bacterium]